jgi:hypothetical protein
LAAGQSRTQVLDRDSERLQSSRAFAAARENLKRSKPKPSKPLPSPFAVLQFCIGLESFKGKIRAE